MDHHELVEPVTRRPTTSSGGSINASNTTNLQHPAGDAYYHLSSTTLNLNPSDGILRPEPDDIICGMFRVFFL